MGRLRRLLRTAQRHFASKAVILSYHRVAPPDVDPWGLCVAPERFEEQMEVLRRESHPVSLRDLTDLQRRGRIPRRTVAVTFDDGYWDNLENALPLLARRGIPATFFIASGAIGARREFWWDELQRLLLRSDPLPGRLELELDSHRHAWDLKAAAVFPDGDRRLLDETPPWEAPPESRCGFHYRIWQLLQRLAEPDRLSALAQMHDWLGERIEVRPTHRAMDASELRRLAGGPGVEIGAHTITHAPLSSLSRERQQAEIGQSKRDLETILDAPVSSFAYPYGDYGADARAVVSELGFERACTTDDGTVWRRTDPLRLPRMHVRNWDGGEFARRLAASGA